MSSSVFSGFGRGAYGICALVLAIVLTGTAGSTRAQDRIAVHNDRGGLLRDRLEEIERLRANGQAVAIQGDICFSTCTLFLGLAGTCVSPDTTFGFHGPSSYGRALDPATFRRASELIASHYPPALRTWYLETGRYTLRRVYRISGRHIIDMGVPEC
jgi:hypothetical protein